MYAVFGLSYVIGLDAASAFGGWFGRMVGPLMFGNRNALRHIRASLPGHDDAWYRKQITGMWDNLGRVMLEYPHLKKIGRERVEIIGSDAIIALVKSKKPAVLFTGHLANWEVIVGSATEKAGLPLDIVYRAPNNPYVRALLMKTRSQGGRIGTIAKSRSSVRAMVEALKSGRSLGILIDQKYNEGIVVPFFGMPARTSPAFAQLTQKFGCVLLPVQVERLGGAHFRITAFPPLKVFEDDGTTPRPAEAIVADAHRYLEDWISQHPDQWLWLHRRWTN